MRNEYRASAGSREGRRAMSPHNRSLFSRPFPLARVYVHALNSLSLQIRFAFDLEQISIEVGDFQRSLSELASSGKSLSDRLHQPGAAVLRVCANLSFGVTQMSCHDRFAKRGETGRRSELIRWRKSELMASSVNVPGRGHSTKTRTRRWNQAPIGLIG